MVDSPSIITSDTYSCLQISPLPGRSIFITCAPISARRNAAEGPDKNWLKSMMIISCNKFMFVFLAELYFFLQLHWRRTLQQYLFIRLYFLFCITPVVPTGL